MEIMQHWSLHLSLGSASMLDWKGKVSVRKENWLTGASKKKRLTFTFPFVHHQIAGYLHSYGGWYLDVVSAEKKNVRHQDHAKWMKCKESSTFHSWASFGFDHNLVLESKCTPCRSRVKEWRTRLWNITYISSFLVPQPGTECSRGKLERMVWIR